MLTSKDVNFVGYTYKNFDMVKGMHAPVGMIHLDISTLLLYLIPFLKLPCKSVLLQVKNPHVISMPRPHPFKSSEVACLELSIVMWGKPIVFI
jgi:hypothetical protein